MDIDFTDCRSMAVLRRNGLGDLLCAVPLMSYLKKLAPEAHLTLVLQKTNLCLAPYLEGYDRLVVLPSGNKYLGALRLALWARTWNLDLAISAKPSPAKLINFLLRALQAKHRVAWVDESWHSCFINRPREYMGYDIHQSLKILQLVAPELSEVPEELYPQLKIPNDLNQRYGPRIQQELSTLRTNGNPLLMVSVSNNRPESSLGIEAHATLLNELFKQQKFNVIVSAEPKNLAEANALVSRLEMPSTALITHSFDEFIQLLNAIDLVFVGDGGIMHMAAALNKPQVVLFGKTRLDRWKPLSKKALCLRDPVDVKNIAQSDMIEALIQQLNGLHNPLHPSS